MTTRRLSVSRPGGTLAGHLDLPADGAPRAFALFAHCFTCSGDLKSVVTISRELARMGIAVLRCDFTGLGHSTGSFADTTFSSTVEDLAAFGAELAREYQAPALLIGHSLGGAAALRAVARLPSIRAVATIGAPFDPSHAARLFGDARGQIEREGQATVEIAGRPFIITRELLDDLEQHPMEEAIGTLDRPLLIFHSPVDEVVGIENAALIFQAARHPKSFVSLDQADHLLTDPADACFVAGVLAAWANRYLEPVEPARTDQEIVRDNRVTATMGVDHYRTDIRVRGHGLVADEPAALGGSDQGPTPYDLLGSALGACTAITLRMYADRKQWPLTEVKVALTHEKIHARDEQHMDDGMGRMDRITREITLVGDLDPEQRARLIEIANKCPVHRTLEAGVSVTTRETT